MEGRITQLTIPEGSVVRIFCNGSLIWEKKHYLDIEPKLLWVYPDLSMDNQVLSDTRWKVE